MSILLEMKWMLLPFLACLVLSINHVYLGIHVIARRVIFVDLALAQIAALGATFALTLGYDPGNDALRISLFSLAFTFVGAGAFAVARMSKEKVPQEAFIGIIYAAASAAAILLLSKSATGGRRAEAHAGGGRTAGDPARNTRYGTAVRRHRPVPRDFPQKISGHLHQSRQAVAAHVNVRFWDILFYMSFGVVITKSVAIVGVLLVFSYLVVPAVIAQMWSETIRGRLLFGWLVAIVASTLGISWSFYSDYPTGPAIVVMLGFLLIFSSTAYYLLNAPAKKRALAQVAAMALFCVAFATGLMYLKKSAPAASASDRISAVNLLLNDLESSEESRQLGSLEHLGAIRDPRIVPALNALLSRSTSDRVIESAVAALNRQKDPRAIPALRAAALRDFDEFLKLTIARTQLDLGDTHGFATLISVLKGDGALIARQQANAMLEEKSGLRFGYNADQSAADNSSPLQKIEEWYNTKAIRSRWDARTGKFGPS